MPESIPVILPQLGVSVSTTQRGSLNTVSTVSWMESINAISIQLDWMQIPEQAKNLTCLHMQLDTIECDLSHELIDQLLAFRK